MTEQTRQAVHQADTVVFMVDARAGVVVFVLPFPCGAQEGHGSN